MLKKYESSRNGQAVRLESLNSQKIHQPRNGSHTFSRFPKTVVKVSEMKGLRERNLQKMTQLITEASKTTDYLEASPEQMREAEIRLNYNIRSKTTMQHNSSSH